MHWLGDVNVTPIQSVPDKCGVKERIDTSNNSSEAKGFALKAMACWNSAYLMATLPPSVKDNPLLCWSENLKKVLL